MLNKRVRADLMLLLAAIIWGTAFIAQKYGNDAMPPLLFVGVRFLIAAVLMAPFAYRETRKAPPLIKSNYRMSVIIGLLLFTGCALQQIGLVSTTATNAGFLTSLYVVFVPFVAWLLSRTPLSPIIMIASGLSVAGAWLLSGFGAAQPFSHGDLIIIIADIAWAAHIVVAGKSNTSSTRPYFISCIQYAITGLLALTFGLIFEPFSWSGVKTALPALLYAGGISSAIAFTLQIHALRHTPAAEGSLIMSLEGVFAAIAGVVLLNEWLTPTATLGCALILLGIVLVEIIPLWKTKKKLG